MSDHTEWRKNRVYHNEGTTMLEIVEILIPAFYYTVTATVIDSLALQTRKKQGSTRIYIIEFAIIVLQIIFSMTVLEQYISIALLLSGLTMFGFLLMVNILPEQNKKPPEQAKIKNFITNARSTINLMSVIAILAVDFKIFPLRFAKTETVGVSLMDVGAALYVYSNGIVAPEVKNKLEPIQDSFKNSLPLFVMGFGRFFLVKQTDYHVPAMEYGTHWNFFVTLGVVKLFGSMVLKYCQNGALFAAITVVILHEFCLQSGLNQFIFSDIPRTTFLAANREGIYSSFGYLAIYLFSVHFGKILLNNDKFNTLKKIFLFTLITFILTISLSVSTDISRRTANAAFCFWILFLGSFMTGLFFIYELYQERYLCNRLTNLVYTPFIYKAINDNALVFFLNANILTGLINMCVDTMSQNSLIGLLIVSGYMAVNCLIVCVLSHNKISVLKIIKVK